MKTLSFPWILEAQFPSRNEASFNAGCRVDAAWIWIATQGLWDRDSPKDVGCVLLASGRFRYLHAACREKMQNNMSCLQRVGIQHSG